MTKRVLMLDKTIAILIISILMLSLMPIILHVEPVLASSTGPSLVVDDTINRINATLGVKSGSVATAVGTVTNIGTTSLSGLLTAIFVREDAHGLVPSDITGEWSPDGISWSPMAVAVAPTSVAWDVELTLGPLGGYPLAVDESSTTYIRLTVHKDVGTSSATPRQQTVAVFVYKDNDSSYSYSSGDTMYSQAPDDYPVKIDLAIVHTAEIEGTGEFYYNIQDAVNAATSTTIILYPGTYGPFTVSGKSSLTIIANGAVVIKGSQSVVTNYANRDAVIFVEDSTDVTLDGLDIEGQGLGTINPKSYAVIYESSTGTIKDCTVSPNTIGDMNGVAIAAWDDSDLTVDPCIIKNFGRIGVFYFNGCTGGVYNSTIIGQVYSGEGEVNYGVEVEAYDKACDIEIRGNNIYNCDNTHPSPSWSSAGIVIDGWLALMATPSSTVVMSCNNIHDNYYGIEVVANPYSYAHYNNIYKNREYGVIQDPDYADNNVTFDARYNWWGNASGPSGVGPGTGDAVSDYVNFSPWLLAEKVPPLVHDVAIASVVPSAIRIIVGTTIQIDVKVKNDGNTYETFDVSLYNDTALIGTQTITDLIPGANTLLTFSWDTTGVTPYGDYTIKAEASTVPGETDVADNVKTATVRIGTAPTIKVEPPIYTTQMLNKTFNINITINDLGDYWKVVGFQFRLCYNSTLLEVVDVTEGSFMKNPTWNLHGTFFVAFVESDGVYGPHIVVGNMIYPNATGFWEAYPSGSGTIATITFKVVYQESGYDVILGYTKPPRSCDLELIDTKIDDDQMNYVPHYKSHGHYEIWPNNIADLNWDFKVDIDDIVEAAIAFGSYPSHPRWNPNADINNDNKLDIDDIVVIALNFGWFAPDC